MVIGYFKTLNLLYGNQFKSRLQCDVYKNAAAGKKVNGIFLPSEGRKRFEKPRSRIQIAFSEVKK